MDTARSTDWALTEREKQTLRLMVRGHDAKSIARSLDLSVHTINERLRDARRKMAVSSSREAARMLFEAEGAAPSRDPENLGDTPIGADAERRSREVEAAPVDGVEAAARGFRFLPGVMFMTLVLGLLALAAISHQTAAPTPAVAVTADPAQPAVVDAARRWLALLDQSDWDASYRATGAAFRKLNTLDQWAAASEHARRPLGAMVSRTFLSQENLPAPPQGYEVVKFRTRFANKAEGIETVTLDREDGEWRVVGVTVG